MQESSSGRDIHHKTATKEDYRSQEKQAFPRQNESFSFPFSFFPLYLVFLFGTVWQGFYVAVHAGLEPHHECYDFGRPCQKLEPG